MGSLMPRDPHGGQRVAQYRVNKGARVTIKGPIRTGARDLGDGPTMWSDQRHHTATNCGTRRGTVAERWRSAEVG